MLKKVILSSILVAAMSIVGNNVFAAKGMYLGVQLGETDADYDGTSYTDALLGQNSVDDKDGSGRVFFGYAFDDFISAELGYGYYGRIRFTQPANGNTQDMRQQGADLSGKLTVPLNYGLGIYLKGGGIYFHRNQMNCDAGNFVDKEANNKVAFLGGFGLEYAFNDKFGMDASWTKTTENGDLPSMDFYAIGVIFHLGKTTTDTSTDNEVE